MEKLIMFTIIVWALYFLVDWLLSPNKNKLRNQYIAALNSKDRALALHLGRKYYTAVSPFGFLRPIDEMTLMNELNTYCK